MKTLFIVLIWAVVAFDLHSQSYQLTDLGAAIGTNSYAQGINNRGQVVGYWDTTNGAHAFMYAGGVVTDLGALGSNVGNNYALSINNAGQVVGFNQMTNGAVAFLFQNGTMTPLGKMGGLGSYAFGINNSGQIVGYVDTTNGSRAMIYDGGNVVNIGTLGGTNSYAYGINNSMQVAGSSLLPDNTTSHAFVWQAGLISDLNQLSSDTRNWQLSDAHGINDGGDIAGWGTINNEEHAFVLSGSGVVTDLGILPGGTNSYALGLNNSNQVVGASSSVSGSHAVVWQSGIAGDLNDLIDASGWELKEASGVNDHGQIVGWGILNGQEHAFLLTPISSAKKTALAARSAVTSSPRELLGSGTLTVTITNPVNSASYPAPTNLTLTATTTDTGGTVTQVAFYIGGAKLLGVVSNSPYSMVWSNATVGIHAFTAVAMDNAAQVATSSVVTVNITTNLLPIADAHVRDGSSTNLNFGTTNLMECLTTTTNGNNRDIYFKFDLTGISNVSSAQLRVFGSIPSTNSISNTVYSVTNTIWTETGVTWSNKPIRVAALATNAVTRTNWFSYDISSHVKSQLAAGNSLVSVALHDPTNYSLLFRVNSKENTTNNPVLVIVTTNNPVNISITNPANNSVFSTLGNITINASAFDSDGVVTQIQFFQGTNLLGSSNNTPYQYIWTNPPAGNYVLSARATDNNGAATTSPGVNITVKPLLQDMTAWWRAEGNALDSVNTNNGNLQGGTSFTNGMVGQAFNLSGTGQAVSITNSGSIDLSILPAWTIEAWIKPNSFNNQSWPTIYAKGYWDISFGLNSGGGNLESWINNGNQLIGSTAVTLGAWNHVALVYDGITRTFYLNGVYAGSGSAPAINTGSSSSAIGAIGTIDSRSCFNGVIDEVSIYNRALLPSDIAAIYNAGSAGKAPNLSVALSSPLNNTAISVGSNVVLNAAVSDTTGTAVQVQFYQGTNCMGVVTNAPYTMVWTNPAAGLYALTARASDGGGLLSTSSVVNLIVDIPPSVTLTNPATNAVFAAGANISLAATASDADGTIAKVQFFIGTNSLGITTNAPYGVIWSGVPPGNYALTAVATDNSGLQTTSSAVNIIVDIPPTVAITDPLNNTVLTSTQANVTVTATASDADGTVTQVQFFQGATGLGVITNAPFSLTWSNVVPGNYSLTAKAFDNLGLPAISPAISFSITPFTVAITNPPRSSVYATTLTNITLNSVVNDLIGTVTQVQYFQNFISLGIATNPPYSLVWSNASAGNYAITAVAFDDSGNAATSSVVNIIITPLLSSNSLCLWLTIDSLIGLTNNTPIGIWTDSSGRTNHATQSIGGNRPTYVTNALNGLPVVHFDGTNSYLRIPNILSASTQGEEFIVWRATTNLPSARRPFWRMGGAYLLGYPDNGGHIVESFANNTGYDLGVPAQSLDQYHLYEVAGQSAGWWAWINGVMQVQKQVNTYAYYDGNYSPDPGCMFGRDPVWGGYFAGDMAEMLVFNRTLTVDERQTVSAYLNGKYGLVPAVPAVPTNLVATAISAAQVSLTWNEILNGGTTCVSIERKAGVGGTYAEVAQVKNGLSYMDTNLISGATYYYRARAINIATWSTYSGEANATTFSTGSDVPFGNLIFWLKADSGVAQAGTNGPISFWADQSGHTNHATQVTSGNRPLWVSGSLNGMPVVHFDGTNSYLRIPNILDATTQSEEFIVWRATTNLPSVRRAFWRMGGGSALAYPDTIGQVIESFGNSTGYNLGVPSQPLNQYHVYEVAGRSGYWAAWFNGIMQNNSSVNTYGYYDGGYSPDPGCMLGRDGIYGGYFEGDIAEMLVFNRTLTVEERQTVNIYLNGKYALVPAVPAVPTNLAATAISAAQVSLTWNEILNGGATRVSIERKAGVGGTYAEVAQLNNGLSYMDTNLTAGTTYYYRVRAINMATWSAYSNEANATTLSSGSDVPFGNLIFWLKADSGVTQAGTNGPAGFWADQSGHTNHATQVTSGNRPLWVAGALNGRPVLHFDGTNSFFNLPTFMTGTTQAEEFVILRVTTNHPSANRALWRMGNNNGYNGLAYPNTSGQIVEGFGSTIVYNIGASGQPLDQYHAFNVSAQTGIWKAWINGLLQGQVANNTYGAFGSSYQLGRDSVWGAYFAGDVAEILVFNRTLTADERQTVNGYLNEKYGLVPAVPAVPTNLVATAISAAQVSLTWNEVLSGGATRVSIERKTGVGGTYAEVVQVSGGLSYIDTNRTAGTTYYYRVRAINVATWSPYSSEANATTFSTGSDISFGNLLFWLKSDSGLAQFGTNTPVNLWADQSGQTNHANQLVFENQPTWLANGLNGFPVVHFDGTNSFFRIPNILNATTQAEEFVVWRATTNLPNARRPFWRMGGAYLLGYPDNGGHIVESFGNNTGYDLGVPSQSLEQYHLYDVAGASGSWNAWMNGVPLMQKLVNTYAYYDGNYSPDPGCMLGRDPVWGGYFSGDVAEMLVFNRTLTTAERQTINTYLNGKYGLVQNVLTAPNSLFAILTTSNQVDLTWFNTTTNPSGIQIERKADVSGTYSVIGEVAQNSTNYTDSISSSGHIYFYRVRASNLAGGSPYSNEASVTVNTPPTVSLTTPTNGTIYLSPANISLSASAVDSDGVVTNVTYFSAGTNMLGSATNAPFSLTWSNVLSGVYSLSASATDNLGGSSNSMPVSVIVSNSLPTVTLTAPTNTQFYFAPAIINLSASASDANGSISRVDYFYNSTIKIGSSTTSPYPVTWTNLTTGNYPLTAVAVDNEGGMATSGVVNITVTNTPPTVSFASPTNSTLYQAPATISMTANAGDVNGYVVKVEYFYAVTNKIGESTVSPFKVFWNNVSAGTNSITAKATDDGGATTTSSAVSIIINAQPTVSITNPVNNATFTGPTNITINATASDSDGTISRVDFYYGINNFIGSDTNAPYSMVLSNAPAGTYPLTAKATDNRGGTSTSGLVYVSVSSNMTDVADAYVRDGTFATTNFGTATTLIVQTNATSGSKYDTYLKFDTSRFSNVTAAKLNVYGAVSAKNNTVSVTVCGTGTNWTENGITWSNRPALGTIIRSTNFNGTTPSWYAFDVTGYVQAQKAAGTNVISLALHATNTTSVTVNLNSKEAGSNPPYLQIFATNSPPSVSITSPTNNSIFTPSNNVSLTASAADSDGSIYKLEFFQGSSSLGVLTNGQTSLTWTNVPFGEYILTAVATDNFGASTTSASVSLNADSAFNNLDPDGDGLTNIEEWLLGTNPQVSDAPVIGNGIIQIHTPLQ